MLHLKLQTAGCPAGHSLEVKEDEGRGGLFNGYQFILKANREFTI